MKNKMRFNQILRNIKSIKIQGASNIAKAGFRAYQLFPTSSAKKKLIAVRPTEPMLEKVLNLSEKQSEKENKRPCCGVVVYLSTNILR